MVVIPAGSFTMGSPANEPERYSDEGPQRRVTIGPFAIGRGDIRRVGCLRYRRRLQWLQTA